jgi:hypothetical protein
MPFGLGFFATAGAGAGFVPAYELIQTQLITTNTASVTFSSIPQTYKHLQIRMIARTSSAGNRDENCFMQLNGDTTSSNYRYHSLLGDGSSVISFSGTSMFLNSINGNADTTGSFAPKVIDILDYAVTAKNTTTRTLNGKDSAGPEKRIILTSGLWVNTAAVTSVRIFPADTSFIDGSRFSLYGIKG